MSTNTPAAEGHMGSIQELALALLEQSKTDNAMVSGAGVWLALAVLAAGSGGATAQALDDLLGTGGEDIVILREELEDLLGGVAGLSHSTAIWSKVELRKEFTSSLPTVKFDSDLNQAALDSWVNEATGGLIKTFGFNITPDVLLALADALAIRAHWDKAFSRTEQARFYAAESTVDIDMMSGRFSESQVIRSNGIVAWQQRTREAGCLVRFAMAEDKSLKRADVIKQSMAQLNSGQARGSDQITKGDVKVWLPKFAFSSKFDVAKLLDSGATSVLLTNAANFSGMSDIRLKVDEAAQRTVIKVDEDGFEAAAVTEIVMTRGRLPEVPPIIDEVRFDRPFSFTIFDGTGLVPLFTGWVGNPAAN